MRRLKDTVTLLLLAGSILLAPARVLAEDTEIYFSAGNAGADINVLFMLDTSGSMAFCGKSTSTNCGYSQTRMAQLKEAFTGLIDSLGGNIRVGVGRFNYKDGGRILFPVSPLDDPIPTEIEVPIVKGNDDADSRGVTYGSIRFPTGGTAAGETGFIFREVRIPRHALVKNAVLRVRSESSSWGSLDIQPAYATGTAVPDFASQPLSSAAWGWTDADPFTIGGWGNGTEDVDITELVQRAISDGAWCGQQDLVLRFRATDPGSSAYREITSGNSSSTNYRPRLHVSWTVNPDIEPLDSSDPAYESSLSCMGGQVFGIQHRNDDADQQGNTVKRGNAELFISDGGIAAYRFRNVPLNLDGDHPDQLHSAVLSLQGKRASHTVEYEECREFKWWPWVCVEWQTGTRDENLTSGNVSIRISGVAGDAAEIAETNGNISSRPGAGVEKTVTLQVSQFKQQHRIDVTDMVRAMVQSGWSDEGALMFRVTALDAGNRNFSLGASEGGVTASLTLAISSADQGNHGALRVRDKLKEIVNDLPEQGSTPMGEAYTEALAYMLGDSVHYGGKKWEPGYGDDLSHPDTYSGSTYISPIDPTKECGSNHVVVMTDGEPQSDDDLDDRYKALTGAKKVPKACDGGSSFSTDEVYSCVKEIAAWAARDEDGKAPVSTHMIGFYLGESIHKLMRSVTDAGNGFTKTAESAVELEKAFSDIINEIAEQNAAMAAPGVAVNQLNRFSFLDQVYFGVFRPALKTHWAGNVKRYRLATQDGKIVIVDQNGMAAVDPATGFFKDNANSFWGRRSDGTDPADGPIVDQGGAVEEMENRSITRKLFIPESTPAPSGGALSVTRQSGVASFSPSKWSDLSPEILGLPSSADNELREILYDWLMRVWGDPLHSEPLLVNYGFSGSLEDAALNPDQQDNTLYIATNDGMLRAIDPDTGAELFSFTTADQLQDSYARYLNERLSVKDFKRKTYGYDGGITLWRKPDGNGVEHVFLYVAQRRGGRNYYAVDVTDRNNPKLLWRIAGGEGSFARLGQTWSRPTLGQVNIDGKKVPVLVFGGGYSPDDHDTAGQVSSGDTMGNAIYIVNAYTGALIWSTSSSGGTINNGDMKWSIAASPALVDIDFDGVTDYIYAADLAGQVFRVDLNSKATSTADLAFRTATVAKLGTSAGGGIGNHRRFFAAPVVSLGHTEQGPMLYISLGSGYRPRPTDRQTQDMIFTIIDRHAYKARSADAEIGDPITASGLVDITSDTNADEAAVLAAGGWYFRLETGEKVVSSGVVIPVPDAKEGEPDAVLVIPSYVPDATSVSPCTNVIGKTRQYSLGVRNGGKSPAMTGTVAGGRAEELNLPGLPPDPQWVVIDGISAVVTGTGAVEAPPVEEMGSFKRTRWFQARDANEAESIILNATGN